MPRVLPAPVRREATFDRDALPERRVTGATPRRLLRAW